MLVAYARWLAFSITASSTLCIFGKILALGEHESAGMPKRNRSDSGGGSSQPEGSPVGRGSKSRRLLSDEREALRYALERGYFEVPRETTIVEVADELGRSDVDVLQDIHRGMSTILRGSDALDYPGIANDDSTHSNSLDQMFDALKHPYRRRILMHLSEYNSGEDEFPIEDIVTGGNDPELLTAELYHVHFPKLSEAGYIDWNEDDETVGPGPNFGEIALLLRLMTENQDDLPGEWP